GRTGGPSGKKIRHPRALCHPVEFPLDIGRSLREREQHVSTPAQGCPWPADDSDSSSLLPAFIVRSGNFVFAAGGFPEPAGHGAPRRLLELAQRQHGPRTAGL